MNRYFLEVSYLGTGYAGFQIQKNANTVQSEVEKALRIVLRKEISLTGSSRTDAGVHALQNYFHFDSEAHLDQKLLYNLNAVLPPDIGANNLKIVRSDGHCRFDAVAREYQYHIYWFKNPFLADRAFYYPYKIDINKLQTAAESLFDYTDYSSFSKRRTQVKSHECIILNSKWDLVDQKLLYTVKANRFLRGMVRGIVGTMLQIGKGKIELEDFKKIIENKDSAHVDFSVPAKGLFLNEVFFPGDYFSL